jgi:hypothetical protein
MDALRSCFARTQTWLQAEKYVNALASELPSRNGWSIAEHCRDRSPDCVQRLLNRASWNETAAMSQVRKHAAAGLDGAVRRCRKKRMADLQNRTDTQAPPPVRPDEPPPRDPGLIPLTVHEVKRLLAAALSQPEPPGHAARWLEWRRHPLRSRHFCR